MLTEKKRLIFFKKLFPILIISICLLMSIGYATVNDVFLNVEGEAVAMIPEGFYVTDISYVSGNGDFANSNINVVNESLLNHKIILSTTDSNSYIKYKIEIFNGYDYDWEFKGVSFDPQFYDNSDITYTLDDTIHAGDLVKSHEYVSLYVTFKYKDGITPSELNNVLNAHINYEFIPCAILMATSETDTRAFRAADYKEDIVNITFEDEINIPDNAVESWDIGVSQTGDVIAFVVESEQTQGEYDLYIQSNTQLYGNKDMSYWFKDFKNVDSIKQLNLLDTSNVTDMSRMFQNTGYNSIVFTLDVSCFDTKKVTNMDSMFYQTGFNNASFTLDVSNFNTSKVTDMSHMFYATGYKSTVFTLDVSNFNTSNVANMAEMFHTIGRNNTSFTLDISNFDTSKVTNMNSMFYNTGYSSTVFTLNLGENFDTSQVTNMNNMFYQTGYNSTVFTLDLGEKFNTINVTDMSFMFAYIGGRSSQFTLDLGDNFNTINVINMYAMFHQVGKGNTSFTLDLGDKFDTSKVTNMSSMFFNTGYNSTIFTLDLGDKFDTSKVTNTSAMFNGTGARSTVFTLDLGNKFNTINVTDMSLMFAYIGERSSQFTLDLGDNFNTINVTNMYAMFHQVGKGNTSFTLDLGDKFDTSKVTNMSSMFFNTGYNSTIFTLDLGDKFDTSQVTDTSAMFYGTGYKSTKMNNEITIKSQNTTSYSNMFLNTAIQSGSKITVNYTNETNDLVDLMIATKTDGANVVKGYNVDVPITFTIEGTTYNAYEGMTWEQWINSDLYVDGLVYLNEDGEVMYEGDSLASSIMDYTMGSDVIGSGVDYIIALPPEVPI